MVKQVDPTKWERGRPRWQPGTLQPTRPRTANREPSEAERLAERFSIPVAQAARLMEHEMGDMLKKADQRAEAEILQRDRDRAVAANRAWEKKVGWDDSKPKQGPSRWERLKAWCHTFWHGEPYIHGIEARAEHRACAIVNDEVRLRAPAWWKRFVNLVMGPGGLLNRLGFLEFYDPEDAQAFEDLPQDAHAYDLDKFDAKLTKAPR